MQEFKYHISCKTKKKQNKTQYIDFLAKQIKHTTQKQSGFKFKKLKFDHPNPYLSQTWKVSNDVHTKTGSSPTYHE